MDSQTAFLIAQIIGILIAVEVIVCMQFKKMEYILIGQIVCNVMTAVQYAFLGGLSGAGVCLIATVQTIVLYPFQKKEKKIPVWLTALFVSLYVGYSLFTFNGVMDIIPMLSAVCFALSVVQSRSSAYRIFIFANASLWIAYDIATAAYAMIITHVFEIVSILIAMIRLDRDDWKSFFTKCKRRS